jgi:hypothetical protein
MASLRYQIQISLTLLVLGCAHAQHSLEERAYRKAKDLVEQVSPEGFLTKCSIDLSQAPPQTLAIASHERGSYQPETNTVFYPEGRYSALTHEYTHFLLRDSSEACKEELAAGYAAWIDRLQAENKRLRLRAR